MWYGTHRVTLRNSFIIFKCRSRLQELEGQLTHETKVAVELTLLIAWLFPFLATCYPLKFNFSHMKMDVYDELFHLLANLPATGPPLQKT